MKTATKSIMTLVCICFQKALAYRAKELAPKVVQLGFRVAVLVLGVKPEKTQAVPSPAQA